MAPRDICFPPFRFDAVAQGLWRGNEPVQLRPKTFAVLRYLLEHPGQLVTKDELLDHVWPDTAVSEELPRISIGELRGALGDDRWAPHFIETVHGRGFRWIASLGAGDLGIGTREEDLKPAPSPQLRASLVGREAELVELRRCFDRAVAGERQIVFVTGEAGIGKTALVDSFVRSLSTVDCQLSTAFGQCLAVHGTDEPYMPVLEALGELGRGPAMADLTSVLRHHAPTWLLHLSFLLGAAELEALQRQLAGISGTRAVNELVDALDALTQPRALLLVLEDMHWSDHATIGLLAALAQRRRPARLMVVGTYRPADAIAFAHPLAALKPELQRKRRCQEIALTGLTEMATRAYCDRRFPTHNFADDLPRFLVTHTDGNPLFIGATIDHLTATGHLAEVKGQWQITTPADSSLEVPESLRELIELQLAGLGADTVRILEAASVAGVEFAAQAVAAAVSVEVEQVEATCTELARRGQILHALGSSPWPDGTVGGRFAFLHALYQSVLYDRVPPARRQRLHRCIGERLESAFAARGGEIAAELAMHFERGGDTRRPIQHLRELARRSGERGASNEAIAALRRALALLGQQPDTPAQMRELLELQLALADCLVLAGGFGSPEVEELFGRCRDLSQELDDPTRQLVALAGLAVVYSTRARLDEAAAVGRQLVAVAETAPLPVAALIAHGSSGFVHFMRGQLTAACTELERTLEAPAEQPAFIRPDFRTAALGCVALARAALGYTDQARAHQRESLAHIRPAGNYYDRALAFQRAGQLELILGNRAGAARYAAQCLTLASRYEFLDLHMRASIITLWARVLDGHNEDIAEMSRRVRTLRPEADSPPTIMLPFFFSLSAEAHAHIGDVSTALEQQAAASTYIAETGERWYEAEVHRLRGEILLKQVDRRQLRVDRPQRHTTAPIRARAPQQHEAQGCFQRALDVARQQQAKLFELRAATGLAHLWQAQRKREQARELLAPVAAWFTEGLNTPDLAAAASLLADLSTVDC